MEIDGKEHCRPVPEAPPTEESQDCALGAAPRSDAARRLSSRVRAEDREWRKELMFIGGLSVELPGRCFVPASWRQQRSASECGRTEKLSVHL
jgi:hypothetical protein